MFPFHAIFPTIALREMRNLTPVDSGDLPNDTYGLLELYCVEEGCDCRRVMLNVLSGKTGDHLATINVALDADDDMAGPFLDPLNVQSDLSKPLLELVRKHLKADAAYVARLERHYGMVKDALADPEHEIHRVIGPRPTKEDATAIETFVRLAEKIGRNDPCPCGSGKTHIQEIDI